MNVIAAPEIKKRGIGAVDEYLRNGPVHVIKNNRHKYVILDEGEYQVMLHDLAEARLAASEADLQAGRFRKGTAKELLAELDRTGGD